MKNYIDAFYTDEFYIYWCIDIYIISYILLHHKQNEIVTEEKLQSICEGYVKHLYGSLESIIPDLKPRFYKMFSDYFNKFVGKKWEIILHDLKRPKTWDNYSMAITLLMFDIKHIPRTLVDICTDIVLSPPNIRPTCADTIELLNSFE